MARTPAAGLAAVAPGLAATWLAVPVLRGGAVNLADVRLLVTDFDGVHTDDAVYVDQNGTESVRCLRADGYGISKLKAAGIQVVVLSAEVNPVVAARCRKLDIKCHQGIQDKKAQLMEWRHFSTAQVAYMGNDENDLDCLRAVGFPFVPSSAEHAVKVEALKNGWHITKRAGGYGAVREVCDLILAARGGS